MRFYSVINQNVNYTMLKIMWYKLICGKNCHIISEDGIFPRRCRHRRKNGGHQMLDDKVLQTVSYILHVCAYNINGGHHLFVWPQTNKMYILRQLLYTLVFFCIYTTSLTSVGLVVVFSGNEKSVPCETLCSLLLTSSDSTMRCGSEALPADVMVSM